MAWNLTGASVDTATTGQPKTGAISVTEAMGRAKSALEGMTLVVEGEVSQFKDSPAYKAVYFPIADGSSTMDCMMWRDRYMAGEVRLRPGLKVRITGRFSVYAAKGRMQFEIFKLEEAGAGNLRERVARLARRLEAEGLMEPSRKLPIPGFCERIAIVTSPHGKVKDDVARTLRRRNPLVRLEFCPVQVEGATAAAQMVSALLVAQQARPDAILLVRGGGSYEDLMPFNDEALARAVASSVVPVVTGIGHEPDTTICDMVSARRCSTPTAAAESIAPDASELASALDTAALRMSGALGSFLQARGRALEAVASRPCLCDPMRAFVEAPSRELDMVQDRLAAALPARVDREASVLDTLSMRLAHLSEGMLAMPKRDLAVAAGRLEALSPLAVISRGYSLTRDEAGRVVSSVGDVRPGSYVEVLVSDGTLTCTVDSTTKSNEE